MWNSHNSRVKAVQLGGQRRDKGGSFLKKLWCCVGERVQQGNLVVQAICIYVHTTETEKKTNPTAWQFLCCFFLLVAPRKEEKHSRNWGSEILLLLSQFSLSVKPLAADQMHVILSHIGCFAWQHFRRWSAESNGRYLGYLFKILRNSRKQENQLIACHHRYGQIVIFILKSLNAESFRAVLFWQLMTIGRMIFGLSFCVAIVFFNQ